MEKEERKVRKKIKKTENVYCSVTVYCRYGSFHVSQAARPVVQHGFLQKLFLSIIFVKTHSMMFFEVFH